MTLVARSRLLHPVDQGAGVRRRDRRGRRATAARRIPTPPRSTRTCGGRPSRRQRAGLLDDVAAIAVGGQQHGLVLLDDDGTPVRPALLWNDNRSAEAAEALTSEFGGPEAWAEATGLVPVASFTVSKLRWVAEHEPDVAARARSAVLPHDWLTHRLRGGRGELTTDRGDASGTGYWADAHGYRRDLVELAFGRDLDLPRVASPAEVVGETGRGLAIGAGTGDNMSAALGLDLRSGDVAVSLGTSGAVFARADEQAQRPVGDRGRFRRRDRPVPAARLHPQRRQGAGGGGPDGRRRAGRPRPARLLRAGRGRPGAAAVPRRGAHPAAAARERRTPRTDAGQRRSGPPGAGRPRRADVRDGRRGERARGDRHSGTPSGADRWRRALGCGPAGGVRDVRRAAVGARSRRVRRPRSRPPGGLGALG